MSKIKTTYFNTINKKNDKYFNRELSLIEFNKRVLAEAADISHPLLERLKFISILSSNLDEFFMIRVAGLKSQIAEGIIEPSFDGMTPKEQMAEIHKRLCPIFKEQERLLMKDILPALEKEGIFIHLISDLGKDDKKYLEEYFTDNILPVLTPLLLDSGHPFPRIINRSLNIAFVLTDENKSSSERKIAFLQLPTTLPRFVPLQRDSGYHFVLLEQIIKKFADYLFPGLKIDARNAFRVTRDADIEIADDEAEDLLSEIAEQLKQRKWGNDAVRLEVSSLMPDYLIEFLRESLNLEPEDVYIHGRPLNLPDLTYLTKIDIWHLKDNAFSSRLIPEFHSENYNIFEAIKKKDFLVHHPFDSFTGNVLKFISDAADDNDVLAIKITLYRTGMNSPIVAALKKAAEKGKEVTAFVELKARFDEENNIIWAKELEEVGVHVVYGVIGLKTHCKITLVVRREANKLKSYLHLSTGNYNHTTSRLYTDIGYFTAREDFAVDAINLFNYLTGFSNYKAWKKLIVAPMDLHDKVLELINRETELHTPEKPGLIFCKMNSLAHEEVINALYRASEKGVKVKLLIRGVCCLKPGVKGLSENIEVRSILGRFLEHSRICYFKNAGNDEVYLTSADWMTRNLHKRVELMFPVKDKSIQRKLIELLDLYWKDNKKSWRLLQDGNYKRLRDDNTGEEEFSIQEYLLNASQKAIRMQRRNLIPHLKHE